MTIDQAKAALPPYFRGILEQEVLDAAFSGTTSNTRKQFLEGQVDLLPAAQGRSPIRQPLSQPLRLLLGSVGGVLLRAPMTAVAGDIPARRATRVNPFLALGYE